ncbi:MAG: ATP-binding protein [bacterium]|nr:ATP-binding protein [bacterium]
MNADAPKASAPGTPDAASTPEADAGALQREGVAVTEVPATGSRLPAQYPSWAHKLGNRYFSGTTSVFVLHGNVHDLVPAGAIAAGEEKDEEAYASLPEFLSTRLFGTWDVVLSYDLGRGLRPIAGADKDRLRAMLEFTSVMGEPQTWPRSPEKVLNLLDRYLNRMLLTRPNDEKRSARARPLSLAVIFEHAQYVLPAGDMAAMATVHGSRLVRMLAWAQNPYIKKRNIAFCLVAGQLGEVNARLVQNPYVAAIEVPMPNTEERTRYAEAATHGEDFATYSDFTPSQLAKVSNGMSLVDLDIVLSQARTGARRVDAQQFRELKKELIERQCHGLLEFFEPDHQLDMVVGHVAPKARLRGDAELIAKGMLEYAPMGYLVCGPVGTGKTFLAECYAGTIGIPCVKLKNFRSKYVGETEGNIERVLGVLRSLGPVVVIIDEADAALGNREAGGDSGTSARVFSMIASQMGDTRYRGRIVWMLLTSRPDRLPVDLKRQGRAEVHLPLFPPADEHEFREMFRVMALKNSITLEEGLTKKLEPDERWLSGSDIESVVLAGNLRALQEGRTVVSGDDLTRALTDFVPSAQGLEREAQELAAVLECTQLSFLPERWRVKVAKPNGRVPIQERFVAIRQILEQ